TPCRNCATRSVNTPTPGRGRQGSNPEYESYSTAARSTRAPGYTAGVPSLHVPPFPAVVAVAIGVLLLLRLVGGSMPWGQLMIAVGPDGRPMRPRVKWYLWTICRGEPPLMAAALGSVSIVLGCLALVFVGPELAEAIVHPAARWLVYLMLFTLGASGTVVPVGVIVLVRSVLDLSARPSSMAV